jgi:hypothetical protein
LNKLYWERLWKNRKWKSMEWPSGAIFPVQSISVNQS